VTRRKEAGLNKKTNKTNKEEYFCLFAAAPRRQAGAPTRRRSNSNKILSY
jgi:hypothetical protein